MTILVGTDFSTESAAAADVGALLAKRFGTKVHLVHVSRDPRAPLVLRTQEEHLLAEDFRRLNAAAESLRQRHAVQVDAELAAGSVVDALCDTAEFLLAEFLVIAASGRAKVLIGSTAERVARQARVPTLVVRAPERMLHWLEGQRPLNVLVGSDLSDASRQAEATAARLGRAEALEVEVVYVAHVPSVHDRYGLHAPTDMHVLEATAEQLLLRDLDAQAEGLTYRHPRRTRVLPATTTADAHLAVLAGQTDLVVVGNRKRAWLEEVWYGSTTRGLLRSARTNVLCVPADPLLAQMPPVRRLQVIVAATDFSALGDQAIHAALSLINGDTMLHLVHVLPGVGEETPEAGGCAQTFT